MIKIGIPRALLYYQYYPMWKTFFEELGADVVVSPPTTPLIMSSGSSRVVADTCLPVKVFCGHVISLVEECDHIFIPAIRSVKSRVYNCAKFLGLPDMVKAVIPECPPILDIDIDVSKGKRELYLAIYRLGQHFTWNPSRVRRAALAALKAYTDYRTLMSDCGLTPPQATERITGDVEQESFSGQQSPVHATIAVIGHPYLLYDENINHRLIHRLEKEGNKVLTPEMLSAETLEAATAELVGRAYWTYEHEVVGAGQRYLGSRAGGIIGIMTFGCGPDSLMMEMVRRQANRMRATPFMTLTLEEHAAEAGIVTRLEAFLDMIHRKKRSQVGICA
ncbi:acyl-CoA dehydratase activase-related protein [Chloroflexota bacterium]